MSDQFSERERLLRNQVLTAAMAWYRGGTIHEELAQEDALFNACSALDDHDKAMKLAEKEEGARFG